MARGKKKVDKEVAAQNKVAAGHGHNSKTGYNPQVKEIIEEILDLDEKKKELSKAQRDLRNKAKTEFGILAGVLAHEVRMRKMDSDVRIQFESGHADLKDMLGYQASLDLAPGTLARTEDEYADPSDPEAEANKLLHRR